MFDALTIANYFISLGVQEEKPISPMKLQKLIYFAHGFYLARYDKPLIRETVQAWRYGPVINSIYQAFREYGNNPITKPQLVLGGFGSINRELSEDVKTFLKQVWDLLKDYTAIQLSNLTHVRKSPWDSVIEENGAIISRSLPISDTLIQDYFKREYGRN